MNTCNGNGDMTTTAPKTLALLLLLLLLGHNLFIYYQFVHIVQEKQKSYTVAR